MPDDRVDIKRTRTRSGSGSDASSTTSAGSHGRRRFPEKLVDKSRRVSSLGTVNVDNGALISSGLANVVAKRACLLEVVLHDRETQANSPPIWGQAGLIRGERLSDSPPAKKQAVAVAVAVAVAGTGEEKPTAGSPSRSSLRLSRFEATPVTCFHNVEDEVINDVEYTLNRSTLFVVAEEMASFEVSFETPGHGHTPSPDETIELRPRDEDNDPITWEYHDVTTAPKVVHPRSRLTIKSLSFPLVRADFEFQQGQKIGMVIYKKFAVTPDDAGVSPRTASLEELRLIYGPENSVNIYTGQIVNVSNDQQTFEHDINTYKGCSGAVIFLLDRDQNGNGVDDRDYGKAIAIHAGGTELSDGTIVNFGFKIRPEDIQSV